MPERPVTEDPEGPQPDVNPARVDRDPLLRRIADMVAYLDLHIGRYQIAQFTTTQKELWADLVDAAEVLAALDNEAAPDAARRTARWWRESYTGPVHEADPRWSDSTYREPDPFAYPDEVDPVTRQPGTREREPFSTEPPDAGAAAVARHALLGIRPGGPLWEARDEDYIAAYEWAKRSVRSLRRTDGSMGRWARYPSPNDAAAFLSAYRSARSARDLAT